MARAGAERADERAPDAASVPILSRRLGRADYADTWARMRAFTDARDPASADELWLCEHAPVYTLGQAGRREHLRDAGTTPVVETDRGGQVTWHGPGQVIVYVLVDLRRLGIGIRELVVRLEDAVIDVLGAHGVTAAGRRDAPGVYVDGAKVAALGLRVRRGRTYHGLALNADCDLGAFDGIDPCGYPGLRVTRTADLGIDASPAALGEALLEAVARQLAPMPTDVRCRDARDRDGGAAGDGTADAGVSNAEASKAGFAGEGISGEGISADTGASRAEE